MKARFLSPLASFVMSEFQTAKDNRESCGINKKLVNSQQLYNGVYDSTTKASIQEMGGTDIFRRLTAEKCDALTAWLNDILLNTDEDFWQLKPTPVPDLPNDVKQRIINEATQKAILESGELDGNPDAVANAMNIARETASAMRESVMSAEFEDAKKRASGMERKMKDQLIEGDVRTALYEYFDNYSIYPSAFLKGPGLRIEKRLKYQDNSIAPKDVPVFKWYAPSPFDIYPSVDADCMQNGRIFEVVRYSREELYNMKNLPKVNSAAVLQVLSKYRQPVKLFDWNIQNERETLENRDMGLREEGSTLYEGLEMWGGVPGYLLKEWGLEVEDELNGYEAHVIMIADIVIMATLNEDPVGKRPYYMSSYKKIPGSFWGLSLPESMEDIQRICNGCTRALADNLAISSGPMVAYDLAQIPPEEDITSIYPWKILSFDGSRSFNTRKAIDFYQPNSNAGDLINVYEAVKKEADNVTGIPSFAMGDTKLSGAGETSSGLSILQGNMLKGIRNHIAVISHDVLKPMLQNLYNWNMLYGTDKSIKGDSYIEVAGPLTVATKETKQIRLNEFLQLALNPSIQGIVGQEGLLELVRQVARINDLNVGRVLPTEEEFKQRLLNAQPYEQRGEEVGQTAPVQ